MTGVLMWILRVLIILMIVRFVVRFFSGPRAAPRRPSRVPRLGGTLVRDPHCGTYVPESRAVTVGSGSNAVHFCSAECRDAWAVTHDRRRAKA